MEDLLKAAELLESSDDDTVLEPVWLCCEKAISATFIPEVRNGIDRPCEESDFKKHIPIAERNLKSLATILSKIHSFCENHSIKKRRPKKSFAVSVLLVCGEHCQESIWSTSETVKQCKQILFTLCMLCHCNTPVDLLIGSIGDEVKTNALFKPALLALRPKLLKDTWKCFPAAVSCYRWLLTQIKSPHLSDHLDIVLPTALIIVDDYIPENRVDGILCIEHIVENVTRTSLRWHGQGDVIYKALEPVLYVRELLLVRPLIRCMTTVLDKIDGGPDKKVKQFQWTRFDDTMQIILQTMELEQRCDLRLAFIESLPPFLESMGLGLVRWSKRLLHVLQEYLEVASYSDMATAKYALLAVRVYLKECQPRIPHHCNTLLTMLLRMLYDATANTQQVGVKNIEISEEVIILIEQCLQDVVQNCSKQVEPLGKKMKSEARFNETFAAVIDRVFV